ncbi:MAG: hypothetical protein LBK53_09480 [Heliobacteriaceae bacterium]|nr:hypothetical protein [Heliobacteriaceae bacterium]
MKTQSFLDKYFQTAAANGNLAHCILFYGSDLKAQYNLALEIARLLNCSADKSENCQCLNCRWIRENKHPAVLTVSKVDNKPLSDTSKTVISIEQARMIKNDLAVTSDYHRVLIFCDKDKDNNVCGLNENNFQAETANALLKTFEEPPADTAFFFLTKDKSDMISTIISRAQSFFVPSQNDEEHDYSLVKNVIDGYLECDDVLGLYERILALAKENDPQEALTQIQNYIAALLRVNTNSFKLVRDFKTVETAKKQLALNMNLQTVVENLVFGLTD